MKLTNEYQGKVVTPEQAVQVVQSGDWVDFGFGMGQPILLDAALDQRKEELQDVKIRGGLALAPRQVVA